MVIAKQKLEETFRRADEVPFRMLGDETVVVNTDTHEVHVLNGTGSRLWGLLTPARSLAELVGALAIEFELDPAEAEPEVAAFLSDLVDKGLVVTSHRSAP
jgi:coenzyme PQQ synthesis protein D (PqqD)